MLIKLKSKNNIKPPNTKSLMAWELGEGLEDRLNAHIMSCEDSHSKVTLDCIKLSCPENCRAKTYVTKHDTSEEFPIIKELIDMYSIPREKTIFIYNKARDILVKRYGLEYSKLYAPKIHCCALMYAESFLDKERNATIAKTVQKHNSSL